MLACVTRTKGHVSNTVCDALLGLMTRIVLVELSVEASVRPRCCLSLFGTGSPVPNTFPLSQAAWQGRASPLLPPRKRRLWKPIDAGLRDAECRGSPTACCSLAVVPPFGTCELEVTARRKPDAKVVGTGEGCRTQSHEQPMLMVWSGQQQLSGSPCPAEQHVLAGLQLPTLALCTIWSDTLLQKLAP